MFVAACSCSLMTLYVLIDHFYKFNPDKNKEKPTTNMNKTNMYVCDPHSLRVNKMGGVYAPFIHVYKMTMELKACGGLTKQSKTYGTFSFACLYGI